MLYKEKMLAEKNVGQKKFDNIGQPKVGAVLCSKLNGKVFFAKD